ncbi:MAG: MarR family transcriptional regulator, partial [Pseudonocardia sp.]|nr:MarR family transcriptional regulator [Pseudonocardia sp.]
MPVPTIIGLFRRASQLMVDELLSRLDVAGYPGVSASEHLIFENLPPDGARVTELAARVGISHQAAGEVVAALESRGVLERRADPDDRRARIVVLTPEGRELVRTALHEIAAIERRWTGYLADAGLPGELGPALAAALE